ncbi:MAG: hypothetical protein WAK26_03730 [Terracidiphilus sp.]
MTVAAAIEIGSGGTLASGLNKAQGAAHGSGLVRVANQGFLEPVAFGTENFRAGWQSLLASLGSDVEGFNETEAAENQRATSAGPAPADAAGEFSAASLPSTVGSGLNTKQETEKGTGSASAGLKLSQADAPTASSAARSGEYFKKAAANATEAKRTRASLESDSAAGSQVAQSFKTTQPKMIAAVPLPEMVTSILATIPQAVVATNSFMHGKDTLTQGVLERTQTSISSDLFADPSTWFASGNLSSHALNLDPVDKAAGASAKKMVIGTEASVSANGAVPAVGPQTEDETAPAAGGIPIQAVESNLLGRQTSREPQPLSNSSNHAKSSSTSQAQLQTQVLDQSEIQTQLGAKPIPIAQDRGELNPMPMTASAASSGQLPAVPRIQSKSGPSEEKKPSASNPLQPTPETGKFDSVQHGNHVMQGQPSGPAQDASALAHAVAGAEGTARMTDGLASRAPVATGEPDSRDPFATLDAGGAAGKPTWIHAGAQRAEAGFQDPALGWVGVRADTSGGGVHAELVPGSADAAQTLGGHLAGLNAYLAEHHTPVETLTLASSESGWTALDTGKDSGGGMHQGSGQQTGKDTSQGVGSHTKSASSTAPELPVWSAGRNGSTKAARLDGNHISVIA